MHPHATCRRVALYGVDALIAAKKTDLKYNLLGVMDEEKIRLREEVNEQVRALNELKEMATAYGFDLSRWAAISRGGREGSLAINTD